MRRRNPDRIRSDISRELMSLFQVLNEHSSGVILNPDVLLSAANQVKRASSAPSWSYQIANLQLQVSSPQNVLPSTCGDTLSICLDLDISGHCEDDDTDCVTDLVLNMMISSDTDHICTWHFDRHIADTANTTQPPKTSEAHPLYHFQHGGNAMKPYAELLGNSLLLPAPRLAFPPLNAILSLDFVLSNFHGEFWNRLREDPTYERLLQASQKQHWKPYIEKLAKWWDLGPKDESCRELWPHLA